MYGSENDTAESSLHDDTYCYHLFHSTISG